MDVAFETVLFLWKHGTVTYFTVVGQDCTGEGRSDVEKSFSFGR